MKYTRIALKNNIASDYEIGENLYIYMEKEYNHEANAFMTAA